MIFSAQAKSSVLALAIFTGIVFAASPTSFCKCTCFTNSTIIPLDAPSGANRPYTDHGGGGKSLLFSRHPEEPSDDGAQTPVETPPDDDDDNGNKGGGGGGEKDGSEGGRKEYRAGNCNDCNRQFCLDYNLPICRGAGMDDVFTTCFQRDSRKDEAVVFIFIVATVGLLGWAAIRPWVARWYEKARERSSYIPVSSGDR